MRYILDSLKRDLGIEYEITGKKTRSYIEMPELFHRIPEIVRRAEREVKSKDEYAIINIGGIEIRMKKYSSTQESS